MRINNLLEYTRYLKARKRFYSNIEIGFKLGVFPFPQETGGYFIQLAHLANISEGKRCFVVGNGPSLKKMNLAHLKDEIVIGTNGLYQMHLAGKININYLLLEDSHTIKTAAKDLHDISGLTKLLAIHNARQVFLKDAIYFNANYPAQSRYWKSDYEFSTQFHHIAYLGGTITYLALQFAFHLGCNPIYLIGVDFNYGEKYEKKLKKYQGKSVVIDEKLLEILKETHFDKKYIPYKIGQKYNVVNFDASKKAFLKAKQTCEKHGVKIMNAGYNSKLDVFEKVEYLDLFK